ncbi:sigma-70 family RNA polymerase sigma factor [uncultured Arthrobacter sp.]|uniref:sigma-70 family RNA polymerase sigma factor n=1 Tax=uncultured Arthrobacter sp. TaxID=114050 RepID=UPI00260B739A|nr:sigma-70 family RNA polymerase sigma factor [uncultured Arthrobacter sp.]
MHSAMETERTDQSNEVTAQGLEAYRRELTGYCYRMLGSGSEAEDAVQETMIKAWNGRRDFNRRSSARTWLYKIAHNVCIDMLRSPQRRARPMELGPATPTSEAVLGAPLPENAFVQPIADSKVIDLTADPADVALARESIRLAFVAALQHLPPLQRSVLILCEVLAWKASEAAALLEQTVAAVNSALQRARKTLAARREPALMSTMDSRHTALLEQYVEAFESYNIDRLVSLLRQDVVLSMPPFNLWLTGPDNCAAWFLGQGIVCKDSRLIPVMVNGTAGFGAYHSVAPGVWEPFAIQVIETRDGRIVGHHNFLYPELFNAFGLPDRVDER